jgi:hypothetical protein
MVRFSLLILLAPVLAVAATPPRAPGVARSGVDIETAATVYLAAELRTQVRASLATMPEKVRQMFTQDQGSGLSVEHLDAVTAAAKRGFQIAVFEPLALRAFADNLDASSARKSLAFFSSDLGRRMVAADVELAGLDESTTDKIMKGDLTAPETPARDALAGQLERDTLSTDSAVDIYLRIGKALAVGTAIGAGMDPIAAGDRATKIGDASARAELQKDLQAPLRRYIAYGYRDLSDEDLQRFAQFLESTPGKRFVLAYNAAMDAGFDAMGRRCGERIGEAWREMAEAEATPPPALAEPTPPVPSPTPSPR